MIQLKTTKELRDFRSSLKGTLGLVPTMGALHDGHQSLIQQSVRSCNSTIVSVFVNPTQFSPTEDFDQYPRSDKHDIDICKSAKVSALFMPSQADIYPNGNTTSNYSPNAELAAQLCGKTRPHFFYGVCNVVERLFKVVQPTHAFFGDKDLQQRVIIEQMVSDLKLSIEVVSCPIVRDENGLALSSRNAYLDNESYKRALNLSRALHDAKVNVQKSNWTTHRVRQFIASEIEGRGLKGDYVEIFRPTSSQIVTGKIHEGDYCCVAVYVDGIRLIDNIKF